MERSTNFDFPVEKINLCSSGVSCLCLGECYWDCTLDSEIEILIEIAEQHWKQFEIKGGLAYVD